jgi:hypothetical protein
MPKGKGLILGLAGLGGVALLLHAASKSASAAPATSQTTVDKTLDKVKAKAAESTAKGSKIDKYKGYAKKGTEEAQSAVTAITNLLK